MAGMTCIRTIRLENVLSYGSCDAEFSLKPLNVFIGPNASGKSNLIEALSLLATAPRDLQAPIREGGGIRNWLWKGSSQIATATVDVTVEHPEGRIGRREMPLRYRLSFAEAGMRFELRDEAVEDEAPASPENKKPYFYYHYQQGHPTINVMGRADSIDASWRMT